VTNAETANEIVRRELEAYYVSPRVGAAPFDIRAVITAALDAKDREVKDWPWVDASKAHPQHGLSVAIIPEGDERIAVGFWDQELSHITRAYIVDGPSGSHNVRALWWSYLPPKPTAAESSSPSTPKGAERGE